MLGMEAFNDSRLLRSSVRILMIGWIAFTAAGCLPEGKSQNRKANAATATSAPNGVNRSSKSDPRVDQVAETAGTTQTSASARPSASSTVATAGNAALAPQDDPPQIPTIEDIPEVPADVALTRFFGALAKLEKGETRSVTILHLGDSHIVADRFSGGLREQFQSRFGNAGRGMVMPGLYLSRGVKFDRGGDWQAAFSTGNVPGPYGITGAKMTANTGDAWLRMTATDQPFSWCEITLDSGPQHGTVEIGLDGEVKHASMRSSDLSWRNIRIEKQARELMIRPKGDGPVTLHSISIGTDQPGVRYVNLGLPGATAMTPTGWDPKYIAGDMQRVAPDLIVLSYGTDESYDDKLNLDAYEAKASAAIARLRQSAPRASLVIIGPPDVSVMPKFAAGSGRASDVCRALSPAERATYARGLKDNDPRLARWHPPYNLDAVRATLRRLAAAHNAFFWDWSKLMGGSCGIHAWVHSNPPLAANDHIHLTEEGSKRSARLLFRELMNAYDMVGRTAATAAKEQK